MKYILFEDQIKSTFVLINVSGVILERQYRQISRFFKKAFLCHKDME